MRKKLFVLMLTLAALPVFHACTFTIPESVEIRGTRNISIPVNSAAMNLGDLLVDLITGAENDNVEILDYTYVKPGTGKKIQAIIIHLPLIKDGNDLLSDFQNATSGDTINLGIVSANMNGSFKDDMNLAALNSMVKGFKFRDIQARLYVRGPSAFFKPGPKAEISYRGTTVKTGTLTLNKYPSAFNLDPTDTKTYTGNWPLENGSDIGTFVSSILNIDTVPDDPFFDYSFSFGENTLTITPDLMADIDQDLNMEILVMIPLILEAGTNAKIAFDDLINPGDDDDDKDIFGRENTDDFSLPVKKLSLKVEFNGDCFSGGRFYLDDPGHPIEFPLSGRNLNVNITNTDLKYINEHLYSPDIGIAFDTGNVLEIVKNFGMVKITVNTDINTKVDLRDLLGGLK